MDMAISLNWLNGLSRKALIDRAHWLEEQLEESERHAARLIKRVRKNTSYSKQFYAFDPNEGRWVRKKRMSK